MPEVADAFSNLMRKVRLGDRKALAQLLQHYEREVHQAACHLLGRALRSSLDPADLVQSVHRTILHGFRDNKFDVATPEKLVALAVTVARNKVLRAARRIECERRCNAALAETAALDATHTGAEAPLDPGPPGRVRRLFGADIRASERGGPAAGAAPAARQQHGRGGAGAGRQRRRTARAVEPAAPAAAAKESADRMDLRRGRRPGGMGLARRMGLRAAVGRPNVREAMRGYLGSWVNRWWVRRGRRPARPAAGPLPSLEALEDRRLLSGTAAPLPPALIATPPPNTTAAVTDAAGWQIAAIYGSIFAFPPRRGRRRGRGRLRTACFRTAGIDEPRAAPAPVSVQQPTTDPVDWQIEAVYRSLLPSYLAQTAAAVNAALSRRRLRRRPRRRTPSPPTPRARRRPPPRRATPPGQTAPRPSRRPRAAPRTRRRRRRAAALAPRPAADNVTWVADNAYQVTFSDGSSVQLRTRLGLVDGPTVAVNNTDAADAGSQKSDDAGAPSSLLMEISVAAGDADGSAPAPAPSAADMAALQLTISPPTAGSSVGWALSLTAAPAAGGATGDAGQTAVPPLDFVLQLAAVLGGVGGSAVPAASPGVAAASSSATAVLTAAPAAASSAPSGAAHAPDRRRGRAPWSRRARPGRSRRPTWSWRTGAAARRRRTPTRPPARRLRPANGPRWCGPRIGRR